ncbi:phosphatidylethanolamine N-methyltransferase [Micractinium conductrix]|uniref:Phosphatidylethanolamine N-methyltransferase n=1 Tax=Micractinium conductrix TaxID=554055 RepID=A0A2P6VIW4_9CHLO|nr:phosphatidylethanolamine N-methyltransferase [Micractinium conductrix]|eukprot:PSC74024.1 phosphatidylethanolamine N-methyltransferase [Micractinium conductrix]
MSPSCCSRALAPSPTAHAPHTQQRPAPSQPSQRRSVQRRRQLAVAALPPAAVLADAAAAVDALAGGPGELASWVLPAAGAFIALAGLVGLRIGTYSQVEYVTAAMLARHVKPGGARVLQLGGTTRDLYYYPAGTVQVTVGGADLKTGLWEQAGMQAKVPVQAVQEDVQRVLAAQAGSSADSVVLLGTMGQLGEPEQLAAQVYRVLKPGGTLVYVQRVRGGPLQPLVGGTDGAVDAALVEAVQNYAGWDFAQWDTAQEATDPHAAGVAIKPLSAGGPISSGAPSSVDKVAFEQLMRQGSRGKQQQQRQSGGSGFGRE